MPVKKVRSRLWNVLLYLDDPTHVAALELIRASYQYVLVVHDRDTNDDDEVKKVHIHCILKFPQARWNTALSEELGIPINYFEKTGSWEGSAKYLLHDGCDDKYQYDPSDLEGPLVPAVMKLLQNDDENIRVMKILELMDSQGALTLTQFTRLCCEAGLYADWRRMGYQGVRMLDEHNRFLWEDKHEDG